MLYRYIILSAKGREFMKKLIGFVAVLSMVFAMAITASAAQITSDEQTIIDVLKAGVVVDGKTVKVPTKYINQAESYLMNKDVTKAEVEEVLSYIDSAKDYMVANNIKDLSAMNSKQMDKMISYAEDAAKVVDVKLTVNTKTGVIRGIDTEGNVVLSGEETIKQTGMDMNATVAVAAALCAVVVVCVVVAKKKVFEA